MFCFSGLGYDSGIVTFHPLCLEVVRTPTTIYRTTSSRRQLVSLVRLRASLFILLFYLRQRYHTDQLVRFDSVRFHSFGRSSSSAWQWFIYLRSGSRIIRLTIIRADASPSIRQRALACIPRLYSARRRVQSTSGLGVIGLLHPTPPAWSL